MCCMYSQRRYINGLYREEELCSQVGLKDDSRKGFRGDKKEKKGEYVFQFFVLRRKYKIFGKNNMQ